DPLHNVTTYEYDGADGLHKVTQPNPTGSGAGVVTQYDHNEHGAVEKMIDPLGNVTSYLYDDFHRLFQETDPDPDDAYGTGNNHPLNSPVTHFAHNLAGWLTSITDPKGNITAYLYDQAGRQTDELKLTDAGLAGTYYSGTSQATTRIDTNIDFT